jgi:hypothetical protein
MKARGWVVAALVAAGVTMIARGGCLNRSKAPDEELASRFDKLCDIARDNVGTPEAGVKKLGRYLGAHLDDIFGELGGTLAAIETTSDDAKHDDRARLARERLGAPWRACERDWMRFADALERDPNASALVDRAAERLSRTIDIIFSGADLRELPARVRTAIDARLR